MNRKNDRIFPRGRGAREYTEAKMDHVNAISHFAADKTTATTEETMENATCTLHDSRKKNRTETRRRGGTIGRWAAAAAVAAGVAFGLVPQAAPAAVTAYYRSESSSGGLWWYDSGEKPWWYNNSAHAVPDENSTANDIHFNNNTHTSMTLNGKWYLVNYLEFESGASTARTLSKDSSADSGMNVYYGIKNASSATHVFAAPVSFDNNAQTVLATNGGLTFNQPVYLNANVTFDAASSKTITISGVVGNTGGTLTKLGAGTLVLSGANTYTKATTLSKGTLVVSNATALGTTAGNTTVASGTTLRVQPGAAITVAEPLALNGGTLYNYKYANTWSGAITLGAASTIQTYSGYNLTVSGIISGSYGLTKSAAGTLTLSAANDFTGSTTVSAGTLAIASGGSVAGNIVNNSAVTVTKNSGVTWTYAGVISGSGTLSKAGAGTLTLSGANTMSGATTVSAGTLKLTGSLANSAVTVSGGTLESGGSAKSIKSLTMDNASSILKVSSANTFSCASGAASLTAGSVYFTTNGLNLSASGSWTIVTGTASATCSGVTLKNESGTTLTSANGWAIKVNPSNANQIIVTYTPPASAPTAGTPAESSITGGGATVTLGSINMNGAASTAVTFEYGTTTSYGSTATPSPASFTASTTAGSSSVTLTGLLPATTYSYRWTISNSAGSVQKTGTFTTATPGAQDVTWRSAAASGAWVNDSTFPWHYETSACDWKNATDWGPHNVIVDNNNQTAQTLSANTTVKSLTYGSSATTAHSLSGAYTLTVNGGLTNASTATHTISSAVALGANTTANVTGGLTLSGAVSGSSTLTKTGTGTLTLSGANTYTGDTTVSAGTLAIKSVGALGTTAGKTTVNSGATLAFQTATGVMTDGTVTEPITLAGGTITNATAGVTNNSPITLTANSTIGVTKNTILWGVVSGSYGLTKTGSGALYLRATNTYTGATTVNQGSVSIYGSIAGNLAVSGGTATLYNNGATTINYAKTISGSKGITKTGSSNNGYWNLSGANSSFTGPWTITRGWLVASNTTALGSSSATGAITFSANGYTKALRFAVDGITLARTVTWSSTGGSAGFNVDSGMTATLNGVISGTGAGTMTKAGAGTLVIGTNAAAAFVAPIAVSAGTLKLANTGSISNSAVTVSGTGILEAGGADRGVGGITMSASTAGIKASTANTFSSSGAANLTGGKVYFDASGWTKTGTTQSWTIFAGGAAATCSGVTLEVTLATGTTADEYSVAASGNDIVVTWTKTQSAPAVGDNTVTSISTTSATLGATVTADGNSTITSYGVRVGTAASPTSGGYSNSGAPTIGTAYTKSVTGLSANTLYYMRGFAVNGVGTGYAAADTTFRTTANAPSAPTGLTLTPTNNKITISWTKGSSSAGTVVVIGTSDPATAPTVRTAYTANAAYGSAPSGLGGKIVYFGTGTSVDVTGLTAGTQYYVRAYAYAGTSDSSSLLNSLAYSGAATGNKYTLAAAPTAKPTGLTVGATTRTASSLSVSWTKGTGSTYTLVLAIAGGTASTGVPVDGNTYAGNAAWGSAPSLGNGKVVYAGNGTSTTVTGLNPGTQYTFVAFSYNLNSSGTAATANYFATKSDAANNYTLATAPSTVATVTYNAHTTNSLTFKYTRGSSDSAGVVIVMKQGGEPTWTPTAGAALPSASTTFGSGAGSAAEGYVVYASTGGTASGGSSLTVTGLTPGTQYYVKAYAYAGSATGTTFAYGTGSTAANGWTLAAEPTTAPGLTVGTRTTNTITLSYTMATTGNRLLIVGYSTDSNWTEPTDGAVSTAVTSGVLNYTSATTLGVTKVIRSEVTANGSVTITNLTPGTTYYFRAYGYNVSNSAAATANYYATFTGKNAATLATEPTGAPTLTVKSRTANSVTLTITKGTGGTNTLVAAHTANSFGTPSDGTAYAANTAYGSATVNLSPARTVYSDNGTEVTITGLTAGGTYYFKAYAYNGDATVSSQNYRATGSTVLTVYVKPNAPTLTATADGKTMVRLGATKNGTGTTTGMILVYGGSDTPSDGTAVPSVGGNFAGGKVIYKGTGSSAIEHVVAAGATHAYRLFSYVSTVYSAAASKSVATAAISGGQVETFSYTNGTGISSANWAQPDNGWSSTGWDAWDSSSSYIKIAQPAIRGGTNKGLFNSNYLNQAGGNAMQFTATNSSGIRAYRAFETPYTSGKVWFMFTVRTQYGGDEDAKSFGAQFMSTAGDSSTIFASVGKPPSRYSSNPRLAITTSKDGSGFPTTSGINWAGDYNLVDYDHGSPAGNGSGNTTNYHTIYGYIDLDASPKKMYASAAYSSTCFTNSAWTNKTSFTWDVNGATVTPASKSVAGMTLYTVGYCGTTYFDEVRVASTWKGLLGGTAEPPENVAVFTSRGDGNELVRLAFTAPANAESVVIVDKTNNVTVALTDAEKALSSGSAGAEAGDAIVAWRGSVSPGSSYEVDCVVKPGTAHKYWAIANGGGATSPAWTAATGTNPVTTGTYYDWEKLDTFSYTNGTKVSESGNTWKGGQGWGDNYWGNSGSGDWYALKPDRGPATLCNHVTNYPDSTGNILCVTNLGDGQSAVFNRVIDSIGGHNGDTMYFAYRMAYAHKENGSSRWAGLKAVSHVGSEYGVFVGKAGGDTSRPGTLGIEATANSDGTTVGRCWPLVGAGGTEYGMGGLTESGGANNTYLVVGKIKWTGDNVANIYATAYYTGGGAAILPEGEPDWGIVNWGSARLGPIDSLRFEAGANSGTIGWAYFDELRWGTSWDQILAGKAPVAAWMDGTARTRYLGDITTNFVYSQPAGVKQSAKVLVSNGVPSTAAQWTAWTNAWATRGLDATWVTNYTDPSVSSQTDTKWQYVGQWTNTGTYYVWGSATGNDTTKYSKDSAPHDKNTNTVNALPAPTALTVTPGDFKETISWTRAKGTTETGTANGRTFTEVMVVRYSSSAATVTNLATLLPTNGTAYYPGDIIYFNGDPAETRYMTVVYRGSDATSCVDAGLAKSNTYSYAAFTVNNSYYSPRSAVKSAQTTGTTTTPTVDGRTTDWVGGASTTPNSAAYSEEEFIWTDKTLEGRTDTDACKSADIKEFRVKATASTVYFLVRLANATPSSVNPTNAYVVVGVDKRRSSSSTAMNWLGDEAATFVGGGYYQTNAAIHYPRRQMAVHYVGGTENTWQVEMYADDGAEWYGPTSRQAACSAGGSSDPCIEWCVSREDLGLTGACTGRFTVATFVNSQSWNNQGAGTVRFEANSCAAVDAMEFVPYGVNDPDGKLSSWDEGLKDGNVNFWADVRFAAAGLDTHKAPSVPSAVTGTNGPGSPNIIWTKSTDTEDNGFVTGYLLEVATNAAFGSAGDTLLYRVNIEGANTTNYQTRTSVSNFYWRVRARDNSGILSPGTARSYTVTGKADRDGPVAKLLYVGTDVPRFLSDPDWRADLERSGDATSVEDKDLQEGGGGKTFGFVIEWYDVNGVYATNKTRIDSIHGPTGSFAWNILSEHGDGTVYGRVSPNWDLLIVDRKATSKPAAETVDGVSLQYTKGNLTVPTENGGTETLTNCWYIDCGKDAVFQLGEIITAGNTSQYMTNYVTNAFQFGGYRDGVELYLTVSAEDSCTQGAGIDDTGERGWYPWPSYSGDSAGSWGDDPRPAVNSSGWCADGPHKARNVTTNQLLKFYVRDNDVTPPVAATNAWGAAAVNAAGAKFTPSLVVATQTVSKTQATNWTSIPGKLAPVSGAGRDTVYQLTDEVIGRPLTFLFNVYDTYLHSGLQLGTAATATVSGRTLTNTAFKVRTWNDATTNWVAGDENTAKYASAKSTIYDIDPISGDTVTNGTSGTSPKTVLAWEFGTVTEASLQSLFGVPDILSYIGTNSLGTTNLVQLHAWDRDNNRTGDQADEELTFGKLMLTDDDATPPQNAGDSLLGTGTNAVEFGTFAGWAKSATGSTATEFATNKLMKGIVASGLTGNAGGVAASLANSSYLTFTNSSSRLVTVSNAYFEFTVEGQNGLSWQAGAMEFKNRRTTTGPTNFSVTVRQPVGLTNYPAVKSDGTVSNGWNMGGNAQFGKASGLYRFQLTGTGASASLQSPSTGISTVDKQVAKVSYRVGWYGTMTNSSGGDIGGTLTVSGSTVSNRTFGVADFKGKGTASDGYWFDVETPLSSSANASVTWSATGLQSGSGFVIRDAQIITQQGYDDEDTLATFNVLKPTATVVEDTCLAWTNGQWIASGGRRVYRIYGWGAGSSSSATWGVNEVQIRGVAKAPTGFEVTDHDLMCGTWTNELAIVDGEPTGYDTHKSGLCVTNDASGNASASGPKYSLRYPQAYGTSPGGEVTNAFYSLLGIRKAQSTPLADTTFAGWTKTGGAAAVTTNKAKLDGKLLLLPTTNTVAGVLTNKAIAYNEITAANVSGATVSGGLSLRAKASTNDNRIVVTLALLDGNGNELASSADTFDGAHVNSWDDVSLTPLSADSPNVRTAQVSIAQAAPGGGEMYVDNVNLTIMMWGQETDLSTATDATRRGYNGTNSPGAKLHLDLASLSANTAIPLSDDTTAMGGSGSTNYTLVSTVSDYDRDRTDDALSVTVTNAFRLYDDDAVAPQAGSIFGGPLGVSLAGSFTGAKTNAGTNLTWTVSDHALATLGTSAKVGFTLNFYDLKGWDTTELKLGSTYIQKSGSPQGNFAQTASEGAADQASATNAWTITVADLYTAFKAQFAAAKNNTNALTAIVTDHDNDRTGDSLAATQQVGRVWFTDQDKNSPRFFTNAQFKGMAVLTNMPNLEKIAASSSGMGTYLTDSHALGGSMAAHRPPAADTAAGLITDRWFTLTDGDLAAVRADNRFAVLANVYDYPETLAGRANTGLQRGTNQYTSMTAVLDGVSTNMANTYIRWDAVTAATTTTVKNVYDAYKSDWSCSDANTKATGSYRHTAFVWTDFPRADITTLLPATYGTNGIANAFRDLCLTVIAYDSDCDRGGDQLSRACYGERIHLRDDDTTPPTTPGGLYPGSASTMITFPSGTATRDNVFWTNNYNVSNMRICISNANRSQDLIGTALDANDVADTEASGIKEYRFAKSTEAVSATAGVTAPTNNSSASYYRFYTKDLYTIITNGWGNYKLFAVDADDDRDGDALCSGALSIPLGYDNVPPTSLSGDTTWNAASRTNKFTVSSENDAVNDPTCEMYLDWTDCGVTMQPDSNGTGTSAKTGTDSYSPWVSYKIYYATYTPTADGATFADTAVTNLIAAFDTTNTATRRAKTGWTNVVGKVGGKFAALATNTTKNILLTDLEPGENYVFAVVGMDKAGNESRYPVYAVGDTIKFMVTQSVIRAWGTVTGELNTAAFGTNVFRPANTNGTRGTPALYWDAKLNSSTHRANRGYSLIYRDDTTFREGADVAWAKAGNSISNFYYAEPDGNAMKFERGQMRYYRATYEGREPWATGTTPLASEEVYALHQVKLSEGRNLVALHGVPFTNTFAGVFGTDTAYWPAGNTPATATRVEFFTSLEGHDAQGTNTVAGSEVYFLSRDGKWKGANGTDVTTNKQADGFFRRPFSLTIPTNAADSFFNGNKVRARRMDEASGKLAYEEVRVFDWSPILMVPTNSAGFSATVACGSYTQKNIGPIVIRTPNYKITPVAFVSPVAAHPVDLGLPLVSSAGTAKGFTYNTNSPTISDKISLMVPARKRARFVGENSAVGTDDTGIGLDAASDMYYDGKDWRWYKGDINADNPVVTGTPINPNDVILIKSCNGSSGSWTWTYSPTNLYEGLPDRHMGR